MAFLTINPAATPRRPALRALVSAPVSALGSALADWLVRIGEARSRRDMVEALNALSDAQLAERGLRRDQIVAYVFRDRLGL